MGQEIGHLAQEVYAQFRVFQTDMHMHAANDEAPGGALQIPGDGRVALAVGRLLGLPPGEGMVWIAAETSVARALYELMLNDRHHPRAWIKAAGYWTRGQSDSHERIGD